MPNYSNTKLISMAESVRRQLKFDNEYALPLQQLVTRLNIQLTVRPDVTHDGVIQNKNGDYIIVLPRIYDLENNPTDRWLFTQIFADLFLHYVCENPVESKKRDMNQKDYENAVFAAELLLPSPVFDRMVLNQGQINLSSSVNTEKLAKLFKVPKKVIESHGIVRGLFVKDGVEL